MSQNFKTSDRCGNVNYLNLFSNNYQMVWEFCHYDDFHFFIILRFRKNDALLCCVK